MNEVFNAVLKQAEKIGLTVQKESDMVANILGTQQDDLQQCVNIVADGADAVKERAYTQYLNDMGIVISKDWNDSKTHVFKKADDGYNYLITSGLVNDMA